MSKITIFFPKSVTSESSKHKIEDFDDTCKIDNAFDLQSSGGSNDMKNGEISVQVSF